MIFSCGCLYSIELVSIAKNLESQQVKINVDARPWANCKHICHSQRLFYVSSTQRKNNVVLSFIHRHELECIEQKVKRAPASIHNVHSHRPYIIFYPLTHSSANHLTMNLLPFPSLYFPKHFTKI